jgi:hypothetical protein
LNISTRDEIVHFFDFLDFDSVVAQMIIDDSDIVLRLKNNKKIPFREGD